LTPPKRPLSISTVALPFVGTNAPPLGFLGNQLLGDLFYTGLLFALYSALVVPISRLAFVRQPIDR
jgi:hypothetical protein